MIESKHGQLITTDYDALKEYCRNKPAPTQKSLKLFVDFMSQEQLLRKLKGKKTNFYYDRGSYGLKHDVEELSRDVYGHKGSEYISNEDLIIALIQAGFDVKNTGDYKPGPNYFFNIPMKGQAYKEWREQVKCVPPLVSEKWRDAKISFDKKVMNTYFDNLKEKRNENNILQE